MNKTVKKSEVSPAGGVVDTNKVMYLYDHVFYGDYIDVHYESYMLEKPDDVDEDNYSDEFYDDDYCYLIGFKKVHNGTWENIEYDIDENAEFSAIVTPQYTQIVHSKYLSYAHECSLCYPLQNDLGTEGNNETYALPENLYDEDFDEHLEILNIVE